MIYAFPFKHKEGYYILQANNFVEISRKSNIMLENGGEWNKQYQSYVVDETVLKLINASIMKKVIIEAFCHMPKQIIWSYDKQIKSGYINQICNVCRMNGKMSEEKVKIIHDVIEPIKAIDFYKKYPNGLVININRFPDNINFENYEIHIQSIAFTQEGYIVFKIHKQIALINHNEYINEYLERMINDIYYVKDNIE